MRSPASSLTSLDNQEGGPTPCVTHAARGASTLTTVNDVRNPHAGEPFTDDDATIAAALEDVGSRAAVLARAHDGRSVVDPGTVRSGACRTSLGLPERAHRRRAGGHPATARCRRSPRTATAGASRTSCPDDVLLEMMAFLAGKPVEGGWCRSSSRTCSSTAPTARAITWGDEMPDEVKARRRSSSSAAACPASSPASACAGRPAVHDRREGRGPGRHVVGEPLPGRTGRRRQPPVLLLVRAAAPLERVLLPAARAARLLRRRRREVRAAPALPVRHGGHSADVGRADEPLAGRHPERGRRRGGPRRRGSSSAPSVR